MIGLHLKLSVVLLELQLSVLVEPIAVMRQGWVDLDDHQVHLLLLENLLIQLEGFQVKPQFEKRRLNGHKGQSNGPLWLDKRSDFPGQLKQSFAYSILALLVQALSNHELSVYIPGKELMRRVGLLNRMKILYLFAPHNDEPAIVVQHEHHLLEEHNGVLKAEQVDGKSNAGVHFLWLSKGHCFHFLGDASQKDELIAPLCDVHLKRKILIIESIAANAKQRAQLIVFQQVIEFAFQCLPSFVFHVPLQFAEEVDEVELEEDIKEGEVLGVDYLYRFFEEVGE